MTNLQVLVLSVLCDGEQPGRVLREVLARHGVRRTAAAFYQLMARLEADRLVSGTYAPIVVGDQMVTERRYQITPMGTRRWAEARAFYRSLEHVDLGRWSDA